MASPFRGTTPRGIPHSSPMDVVAITATDSSESGESAVSSSTQSTATAAAAAAALALSEREKKRIAGLVSDIEHETENLVSAVDELEDAYKKRTEDEGEDAAETEARRRDLLECIRDIYSIGAVLGDRLGSLGGRRLKLPRMPKTLEEATQGQTRQDASMSFSAWKEERALQGPGRGDGGSAVSGASLSSSFSFTSWKAAGGRSTLSARRAASAALGLSLSMLQAAVESLQDLVEDVEQRQEEDFQRGLEEQLGGRGRGDERGSGDIEAGTSMRSQGRHRSTPSITTIRSEREEMNQVLKLLQMLLLELKKHSAGWQLQAREEPKAPSRPMWDTKAVVVSSRRQDRLIRMLNWLWCTAAAAFVVAIAALLAAIIMIANR